MLFCFAGNASFHLSIFSVRQSVTCIFQFTIKYRLKGSTFLCFDLYADINALFYYGFFRKRNMVFGLQYNFFYV